MKIIKREIIVNIAIIAVMLIIGFRISEIIINSQNDKNAEYRKAVHIEDPDLFQYAMKTNIGNAFVYGNLVSVDTGTYPEIGGEYIYVKRVEERYERHEKWITEKDSNGKEYNRKRVWYQWDTEDSESKHAKEIEFCGVTFPYEKIIIPSSGYIDTVKGNRIWSWKSEELVKVRFKYYGTGTQFVGTIYSNLQNDTISNGTKFYNDMNIEETFKRIQAGGGEILFWVFWIILIVVCVYGFRYLENKWLK